MISADRSGLDLTCEKHQDAANVILGTVFRLCMDVKLQTYSARTS